MNIFKRKKLEMAFETVAQFVNENRAHVNVLYVDVGSKPFVSMEYYNDSDGEFKNSHEFVYSEEDIKGCGHRFCEKINKR